MLRKTLKVIFAFMLFSIYPGIAGFLLYSFHPVFLVFLPIIIAFLLGLGWGMYGQKAESENQSYVIRDFPAIAILFFPAYFLIRSIKEKPAISGQKNGVGKNLLVPSEYMKLHLKTVPSDLVPRFSGIISASRTLDSSKALRGNVDSDGFSLRSNMHFSGIFGNRHLAEFHLQDHGYTRIEYRSRISQTLLATYVFWLVLSSLLFLWGVIGLIGEQFTIGLNRIISSLLIFLFSFISIILPLNIRRRRECRLIIETLEKGGS